MAKKHKIEVKQTVVLTKYLYLTNADWDLLCYNLRQQGAIIVDESTIIWKSFTIVKSTDEEEVDHD